MGIKHDIYRYFHDRKQYRQITQEQLDRLSVIMERFEISSITCAIKEDGCKPLAAQLKKLKLPHSLKGSHTLLISETACEKADTYVFSPKEFMSLLDTPDYIIDTEIPRVLNTIENEFDSFLVIGDGAYSDKILSYLSSNTAITVKKAEAGVLKEDGKNYVLDSGIAPKDTFVIVADFRAYRKFVNTEGQQLRTFFFRRLYAPFKKVTEYLLDLNSFILPKLRENGVHVVWVFQPDEKALTHSSQMKKKLQYWERLSRFTPQLYQKLRHKAEENTFLAEEQNAIINDNTRGYSTNYHSGKYINYENGFRCTVGNTNTAQNSIFIYGPCFVRGNSFEDSKTIPSMIKAQIDDSFNVYNMGSTFHTINFIMREKPYNPGDIVVVFGPNTRDSDLITEYDTALDLTDIYNEIPDVENHVFDLAAHFDHVIAEKIADTLVRTISAIRKKESGNAVSFGPASKRIAPLESLPDKEFVSWLNGLSQYKKENAGRKGAIVMNCNPFTNGHKYLIETASNQVDNLYVFVVEEDKSEFRFADRIDLVRKGCSHLNNVTILPSGKFVVSAQTLPGYFDKKNLGKADLNAAGDLEYFLYIARYFGITARFAGQEPLDQFTNQYNINMKKTLPRYGVEFIEIPRKESGDGVISASRVRKAMHEGDWNTIAKLVPETTLEYLKAMHK